ncbi:MAG TPA: roadblock/LC7 domain-containing protein [Thermoanaerobaculia bacterium]|jgi:predicted regulator of Ras-like GTPase activity (Roadblock/LC7/MglB family)|nr:roadblock/LC7 domain-containing protein [Thermoanaerobaculia bacterium]
MFLERLNRISSRIDGAIALSLVAADGIPVESVNTDPRLDLEVLAAELIAQVRVISDDHRELNVGEVRQLAITTDLFTLMVTNVADGYYLLLVLADASSYGRARFELRRARLLFEPDLT